MKEEREGKICAGTVILSLWALIPTDLAEPTEQPSRARPFPAPGVCLPGWKPAVTEQSQVHSQDSGAHLAKMAVWTAEDLFAPESRCYKQGVCRVLALRRGCVLLHGLWWRGLHISRSLNKGSTSRFVFISVFTVFRNIALSPYLQWERLPCFLSLFLPQSFRTLCFPPIREFPTVKQTQSCPGAPSTFPLRAVMTLQTWQSLRPWVPAPGCSCGAGAEHSRSRGRRRAAASQTSGRLHCCPPMGLCGQRLSGSRGGLAEVNTVATLQQSIRGVCFVVVFI